MDKSRIILLLLLSYIEGKQELVLSLSNVYINISIAYHNNNFICVFNFSFCYNLWILHFTSCKLNIEFNAIQKHSVLKCLIQVGKSLRAFKTCLISCYYCIKHSLIVQDAYLECLWGGLLPKISISINRLCSRAIYNKESSNELVIRSLAICFVFFNFVNNITSVLKVSVCILIYYWFFKNAFNMRIYCTHKKGVSWFRETIVLQNCRNLWELHNLK